MYRKILSLAVVVALCLGLCPVAMATVRTGGWSFEEVLPCVYDEIGWPSLLGIIEVRKDGKWGLVDEAGQQIVPCQYEEMGRVYEDYETEETLLAVKQNGKWGLMDRTGTVVAPFQYDDMASSWGYTEYVDDSVRLLLRVKQNGKQGFIDQAGQVVIPLTYADAGDFVAGYAAVADAQGRWGFIDTEGQMVIPCQYSAVGGFNGSPALAPVKTAAGQCQFIDQTGAAQITCQNSYDWMDSFGYDNQFAAVAKGRKQGLIDREGREVMPCQYDMIQVGQAATDWDDGSWTIYANQKTYAGGWTAWQYGLRSGDGTVDTGLIYERDWELLYSPYPGQGLVPVSKFAGMVNGYPTYAYGYVDQAGEEVIPCKYDFADDFSYYDGLAPVELDGKAGFIDPAGEVVIPMTYGNASVFNEDGLAPVATGAWPNYQWGVIDTEGNTVVPCSYSGRWMVLMSDGLALVGQDDAVGLLTMTRPGVEDLGLPVSGVMVNDDYGYRELYYTCSKMGKLTVDGYLAEEDMVLAAMYDEKGKLTGVEILTADQLTAWLDIDAAKVKLFWLGDGQNPQSAAETLWER